MPPKSKGTPGKPGRPGSGGNIFNNAKAAIIKATTADEIALKMKTLFDNSKKVCLRTPSTEFRKPNRRGGTSDGDYKKEVLDAAKIYIGKLEGECGGIDPAKVSTEKGKAKTGSNSSKIDPANWDIDTLSKKIQRSLLEDIRVVNELETIINQKNIGNISAITVTGAPGTSGDILERERSKPFTSRKDDLKLALQQVQSEVKRIVELVIVGTAGGPSKDPYLKDYYNTLIALESMLASSLTSRSTGFPSDTNSARRLKALAEGLSTKITTLKFDVEKQAPNPVGVATGVVEKQFSVNFINNNDIRDQSNLKKYLTSTDPLYYIDIFSSSAKYRAGDTVIYTDDTKTEIAGIITSMKWDSGAVKYTIHTSTDTIDEYKLRYISRPNYSPKDSVKFDGVAGSIESIEFDATDATDVYKYTFKPDTGTKTLIDKLNISKLVLEKPTDTPLQFIPGMFVVDSKKHAIITQSISIPKTMHTLQYLDGITTSASVEESTITKVDPPTLKLLDRVEETGRKGYISQIRINDNKYKYTIIYDDRTNAEKETGITLGDPLRYAVGDLVTWSMDRWKTVTKGTIKTVDPSAKYTCTPEDGTPDVPDVKEDDIKPVDPTLPSGIYRTYTKLETYGKIEAISGYAFLQVLQKYNGVKRALTPEEAFVFENDLCKYLFRLPKGKEFVYAEAMKNPIFQKQIKFLTVIHQMHFIGTLLERNNITGSVNPDPSPEEEEEKNARKEKDDAEAVQKGAKAAKDAAEAALTTPRSELKALGDKIKTLVPDPKKATQEADGKRDIESAKAALKTAESKKTAKDAEIKVENEKLKGKKDSLDSMLSNGTKSAATLKEIATINAKIATLNTELGKLVAAVALETARRDSLIIRDKGVPGLVIGFTEEYKIEEEKIKDLETALEVAAKDLAAAEAEVTKTKDAYEALVKSREDDENDKVYLVPPFRGPPIGASKNSNDVAQTNQLKTMFSKKYKYTRDYRPAPRLAELNASNIDQWIVSFYKSLQDETASVQSLKKIQAQLEMNPSTLIPKAGVSEKEAAAAPGVIKLASPIDKEAEKKEAGARGLAESEAYTNQLQGLIYRTSKDFMDIYQPSLASELQSKPGEKKIDISRIKLAVDKAMNTIRSSKSGYELTVIEEKYARIADLVTQYTRLKTDKL
jgi:hypothetical protein